MGYSGSELTGGRLVAAVSGGSDSMALLHILAEQCDAAKLSVATVDHGVRAESLAEARYVEEAASALGLPHRILTWQESGRQKPTSESARLARYSLLADHAAAIGAGAIAFGHTMDDQAETVLMRALRVKSSSGTRGLAGMSERTAYAANNGRRITLLRPLLDKRRQDLRDYLGARGIGWIDDPSNESVRSERIRARRALEKTGGAFPPVPELARLADVAARGRAWMAAQSAALIVSHARFEGGRIVFAPPRQTPPALLDDTFASLVLAAGGQMHRPPRAGISGLAAAWASGRKVRKTVGRSLVSVGANLVAFERERRNVPEPPKVFPVIWDGRYLYEDRNTRRPFIAGLERFRPACDDAIHLAVCAMLEKGASGAEEARRST